MALPRRRHVRRDALIVAGSFLGHALAIFFLATEVVPEYHLPHLESPPAVDAEIVPPPEPLIIPPPPPPPEKPVIAPKTHHAPTPAPTPQPQPKPAEAAVQSPPKLAPAPVPKPTAPSRPAPNPTPMPAPKPAPVVASPLAPAPPAAQPGPPKLTRQAPIVAVQPRIVSAPALKLHKDKDQKAEALAPPLSIPGGVFAAPQPQSGAPPAGAASAAAGAGAGFPYGPLPNGFGSGLRGSLIGCVNADLVHLTEEERARCNARLGEGAHTAPTMDPIGASRRGALDDEAARDQAQQKYRDSMPVGTSTSSQPGVGAGLGDLSAAPKLRDVLGGGSGGGGP